MSWLSTSPVAVESWGKTVLGILVSTLFTKQTASKTNTVDNDALLKWIALTVMMPFCRHHPLLLWGYYILSYHMFKYRPSSVIYWWVSHCPSLDVPYFHFSFIVNHLQCWRVTRSLLMQLIVSFLHAAHVIVIVLLKKAVALIPWANTPWSLSNPVLRFPPRNPQPDALAISPALLLVHRNVFFMACTSRKQTLFRNLIAPDRTWRRC